MIHMYFDDPYIYGPLTEEETKNIPVNHRLSTIDGNYYLGVSVELEQFADKKVERPIIEEQ
jgi:hypothetical protein